MDSTSPPGPFRNKWQVTNFLKKKKSTVCITWSAAGANRAGRASKRCPLALAWKIRIEIYRLQQVIDCWSTKIWDGLSTGTHPNLRHHNNNNITESEVESQLESDRLSSSTPLLNATKVNSMPPNDAKHSDTTRTTTTFRHRPPNYKQKKKATRKLIFVQPLKFFRLKRSTASGGAAAEVV